MKRKGFSFFDVDGTLVHLRTMFAFNEYWYKKWLPANGWKNKEEYKEMCLTLRNLEAIDMPREVINRCFYSYFAGRTPRQITDCVSAFYNRVFDMPKLFIRNTVDELRRLQTVGIEPVFVSGSFKEVLLPLADKLKVRYVLSSNLEILENHYTGRLLEPQLIGKGKADTVRNFIRDHSADAQNCYAFGDHISDLQMLEIVSNPIVVESDLRLTRIAENRGWRLIKS